MGRVRGCRNGIESLSDSQITTRLAGRKGVSSKNKRIGVTYNFIGEVVSCSEVRLNYEIPSKMVADGLMKPLPRRRFDMGINLSGWKSKGRLIQID